MSRHLAYTVIPVTKHMMTDIVSNMDQDDLIDLIKCIDRQQADWDFTRDMFEYFQAEMNKLYEDD